MRLIYFALFANLVNFAYGVLEYELLKFEIVHIDGRYAEQNFTMKRTSGGDYSMDFCTTLLEDMPTTSEFEIHLLRNKPGNDQFIPTPLKMPKVKLEKFMNQYYKKYLMEDITKYSNLLVIEGEYEGPFPKGYYWAKDYRFNTDNFPGVHLPSGLYKGVGMCYIDEKLVYKAEATFKLLAKN